MGETVAQIRGRARHDAEAVLDQYWPSRQLPIDPVSIAHDMGLSVFTAQLGDDTWGMFISDGGSLDIYLDVDQPPKRRNFTCAHEIGHYWDRRFQVGQGMAFVDKRSDEGKGSADEVYANEFAASLLMPEDVMKARHARGQFGPFTNEYFGVSSAAFEYRRKLLGLV